MSEPTPLIRCCSDCSGAECDGTPTYCLCHADSESELAALHLRVEELTHEREQLWAGMTPEAHARVGGTVDRLLEVIDQWRTRAEKAERAPKIELEQETDGRWLAEYKEIPGMMVYGATIGEALRKLANLIEAEEK